MYSVGHTDLRSILRETDRDDTGFVNTKELRNIILRNNFGLTGNEIDVLINFSVEPNASE